MRAVWNNTVIAEAPKETLIRIEGNWYFPPESLRKEFFQETGHHTICHWKGDASYYDVVVNNEVNHNAAWFYPQPLPDAITRVKQDFTNYVAFWNGVEVSE